MHTIPVVVRQQITTIELMKEQRQKNKKKTKEDKEQKKNKTTWKA